MLQMKHSSMATIAALAVLLLAVSVNGEAVHLTTTSRSSIASAGE
jgi:hypothetical protein